MNRRVQAVARGGTVLTLGTVGVTNLLRILSTVALTRLLDAEAFGIVAIIGAIAVVVSMVSDMGIIPFVVRHERGAEERFLDEVWTARLARGCVLALAMAALAYPVASYTGKPDIAPVMMVWGVTFFVEGLSSLAFATELRAGRVARLSLLDILTILVQVVVSIIAAVLLRSYWAIIIATLVSGVLRAVLSYSLFPGSRRRPRLSKARIRELWKFSRFIASSSILSVVTSQADKLALGRTLSLQSLGYYSLANSLATTPLMFVSQYCERVLYPSYAETFRTDQANLRAVYYEKKRSMAALYMFGVGGLVGAAPLLTALLYDPRYSDVAGFLQILAISPMLALNNVASDHLLIATGRAWASLATNIARSIWLAAGIVTAIATDNPMLVVLTAGTIEVPSTFLHWYLQWRFNLLSVGEEIIGFAAGGVGILLGVIGSKAVLAVVSL